VNPQASLNIFRFPFVSMATHTQYTKPVDVSPPALRSGEEAAPFQTGKFIGERFFKPALRSLNGEAAGR
jgi:hypothetical protein